MNVSSSSELVAQESVDRDVHDSIDTAEGTPSASVDGAGEAQEQAAAWLSTVEARVLACLMEKELTVADTYPLTLNSLALACNQKSNREPQMKLSEGEIGHTAIQLAERELIVIHYGDRAHRYEHRLRKALDIDRAKQALLCVMMLRAPQTLNELKTRTQRMIDFPDIETLFIALDELIQHPKQLVVLLPKGAGQREDRYTHTLCGKVVPVSAREKSRAQAVVIASPLEERLAALEHRVAALENLLTEVSLESTAPAPADDAEAAALS